MAADNSSELIKHFRSCVPTIEVEESVFLNSSFHTPLNTIVANSISDTLNQGLGELNPKPEWIAQCETVRSKIARFINASPEDMVYTRDTTEACNIFQHSIKFKNGDNIILLRDEHQSQASGWLNMIREGLEIKYVEIDENSLVPLNAHDLESVVDENTVAIGLSSITFSYGLRTMVKSICSAYRPRGIHVLVDATQEIGFGSIDVKDLGVSALAFGIFKGLSCPTGLGLLYIDPTVIPSLLPFTPIMASSISLAMAKTAQRYEHTNKAILQCLALGKYLDFLNAVGMENVQEYLENLGQKLRSDLVAIGVETIGPRDKKYRSPQSNVISLTSPEWDEFFIDNNVYVSQYSHGVRVSFGLYNSFEDVDRFVAIVKKGLSKGLT